MTAKENCILCLNKFEENSKPNCSPKLRELCYKYLHSSLTQNTLLRKLNSDEVPFLCAKCFEFMKELNQLNNQLECLKKRISKLVFIRSLEILYRRGKHPGHPKGSTKQNRSNYRKSQRQLIEFDVSEFPNCEFKKACSDITDSIETSTEDFHNFSSPSLADICEDDEELQNSLDKVKVEMDDFGLSDDNEGSNAADSFIDETNPSYPSSDEDNRNKKQNPISKLQKLNSSDSDEQIILMGNEQNYNGNNKRRRKMPTTRTKVNCGGSKLTAPNKVNTSDSDCSNSDEQISMMEASVTNSSSPRNKRGNGLKIVNNKTFQCVLCEQEFPTKDKLEVHKAIHSRQSEERTKKSDADGKKFNSKGHLLKHKMTYASKSTYKCDFCPRAFLFKHNLLSHKFKIHQQGNRRFNCDFCGKRFLHQEAMIKHKRMHTGEKPYKCEVCGKKFIRQYLLKCHSRIHTGERPYQCEICGKNFTQRQCLVAHQKVHSDEKPHKCELCGREFIRRQELKLHMRTHSGEKPFICEVCGKGYIREYDLKVHIKSHSEEKPFNCEICKRGFLRKKNMLVHKCHRKAIKELT